MRIRFFARTLVLLAAVVATFAGLKAEAASDPVAWVGGGLGLAVPNQSGTSARPIFSINGGAKLGSEFGIGAYYMSSRKDESMSGVTVPWNYDLYGVSGTYHFEGEAKGVYLGGMLGMSKVATSFASIEASTSPMHWGLLAGYDHMILSRFSLGGEISYISIASGSATVSGVTRTTDAFASLNFLASAKLWF